MRSVILGLSACLLAGCTTVSMTEGQTTVKTELAKKQSELQLASADYRQLAKDRGWVNGANELFSIARTLMHGEASEKKVDNSYSARINAKTDASPDVLARISMDADAAKSGLLNVQLIAQDVLATADVGSRADVLSFERALVQAQKAHKSFNVALSDVAQRTNTNVSKVDSDLAALAGAIDNARDTADALSDKYTKQNANLS